MIRLDNISKQNGHQLLFIEASAALNKGEKAVSYTHLTLPTNREV